LATSTVDAPKLLGAQPRSFCHRCGRPTLACVCPHVPRVANRTPVYILQHPRERFHPFGSVHLLRLGLAQAALDVFGPAFEHQRTWSQSPPAGAALLYPSATARNLSDLSPSERPSSLVVVDGTWSTAKSVLKATPWLGRLPHVRVRPQQAGLYRIRREPALHCMSTLEAVVQALRILEPDTSGLDDLLAAFTRMIDRHLALRAERPSDPFRRRRPHRPQQPPHWLTGDPARLVLAHVELVHGTTGDQVVYCVALRPMSGESFAALIKPEPPIGDQHLERMGLRREELARGLTLEAARTAWREFVHPDDIVIAWTQSNLEVLRAQIDARPRQDILLKAAYCNLRHRPCGELTALPRAHGLAVDPTPFVGRAGERVGCALALLKAMIDGRLGP
jgi:DTW domain-containing protein